MVMSSSKLATELDNNINSFDNETNAINGLATAWETYFYDSSVLGITATPATLTTATTAMKASLVGMSQTDQGATKIQAGIQSFWTTIVPLAPTIWITAPLILSITIPPNLGTIAANLTTIFASNTSGELSKTDSLNAVATSLHTTNLGAIATLTPPPPATAPIL